MEQSSQSNDTMSANPSQHREVRTLALESAARRIGEVVRGKQEIIRLALVGFLARGHILLEDVPGVGKTTLARAMARVLGGSFSRIQMTADMLPADIVGGTIADRATGELVFRKGPVFANVVLADELNRATPRTQSGLLEGMAERSVSVDGQTHPLPDPFFVIATQNPIEHHGVYVLPQSQMDRFLLRMDLGYPARDVELALLQGGGKGELSDRAQIAALEPALTPELTATVFEAVDEVSISSEVARYLQSLVRATRTSAEIRTGVSTRGALLFARAARAHALLEGRRFVTPDDIRTLAIPVLSHRVWLSSSDRPTRSESESVLRDLVAGVPVPV